MTELYNTESPIDRKRRNNINATWDDILNRFANLQRQINILAGGQEVDELIARLEQAIKAAEIDVQNYIIQVDESVQQAINKNNNALQTALQTVAETLGELNIAISKAETATEDATNAKNATIQATQDAQDAIKAMQSLIDNFSHRGTWSTTTQYYKNNLVEVDGRTYIALKENINTPVTNKSTWALFADKGAQGAEGPRGLPGKDGKDGTGVNIIGGLTSEDELPTVGTPGDAYMIGGDLYVWQDDTNSWKNVGPIQGPEGKSAYYLAIENGFEGTVEEWIESLKGETGPRGPEGPQGPPGQDADLTEVTEQLEQMKPKVDNSWQKGVYNDADIVNLGAKNATKTIIVADTDWKGTTNVEVAQIVLPLRRFSGLIKVSFASTWINFNAGGGAEVVYQIFKVTSTTHVNNMIINNISSQFAEAYRIQGAAITESGIVLSIVKSPQAKNTVVVKIELLSVFEGGDNDVFNALKNTTVEMVDIGLPPIGGYPWKPQSPTALMANTYNASNTITNVGANRATRVFPQVNWKGAQSTPELWESILIMTEPVWGILELDIAGYSAASGGAKIVVELGISVPNDTTSPSIGFRNEMKIVTASTGFTDNFYVRVEHRPSVRYLIIQVFKRIYNDPVSVVATFTSTVSPQAAFETLKGFSDGVNYTNGITIPTTLQKDFDARIKENFTLFGDFKNKLAPAITEKGVPTNADATADQIVANVRAIPTGGRKANGTVPSSASPTVFTYKGGSTVDLPYVEITGLSFTPSIILLTRATGGGNMTYTLYTSFTDPAGYLYSAKISLYTSTLFPNSPNHNLNFVAITGGYRLPVTGPSSTYNWYAYE